MNEGLIALIGPENVPEFFSCYEENQPYFLSSISSQDYFKSLPILASLDSLINSWPTVIQAHLPDVRDEVSSIDVYPKDAKKIFNNGMGLLFNEAEKILPN